MTARYLGLFVTALVALLPSLAEASQRTIEHIDRALEITNVEMQAVYSGRYTHFRPDTIRRVLGQLQSEATAALQAAESVEARTALADLLRSTQEEVSYSYRFQYYRLESTRLLLVNYQRFLNQARQSESLHGNNGGSWGGHPGGVRPCNGGVGRVGCLN